MIKTFPFALLIVSIIIVLLSCNENQNGQNSNTKTDLVQSDTIEVKSFIYNKYKLPLSIDIYKFLKSKNVQFNRQYIVDLSLKDKFFTDGKRAIALGLYSSDLMCTTIYDISQESINYFSASMEFASKLDIEDGFNADLMDKANQYIDNSDSLTHFAKNAYCKTCSNLEKNNRDNILPLIVLGSWVESMHFLSKSSVGTKLEDGIFKELYNQKENLINLISYFSDVNTNAQTSDLKNEMAGWHSRLEQILVKFNALDLNKNVDQFNDVIYQIELLRTEMMK